MVGFGPEEMAADPEAGTKIMTMLTSLTDDGIQHDLDVTLEALGTPSDAKLGCIGFCLGARAVFRTMERQPDRFVAGAMWHPSFLTDDTERSPHLTAGDLTGQLYIGIGEADQVQSIAMHQRFLDAVTPLDNVEVVTFPGADHGFSWPGYDTYDENAATTSWAKTTALFDRTLR
jgi:carboxymethylenebutenolidase